MIKSVGPVIATIFLAICVESRLINFTDQLPTSISSFHTKQCIGDVVVVDVLGDRDTLVVDTNADLEVSVGVDNGRVTLATKGSISGAGLYMRATLSIARNVSNSGLSVLRTSSSADIYADGATLGKKIELSSSGSGTLFVSNIPHGLESFFASVSGSGGIVANDLGTEDVAQLEVSVTGSGEFSLNGIANVASAITSLTSSGEICMSGSNAVFDSLKLTVTGSGEMRAVSGATSKALTATLSGSGDVKVCSAQFETGQFLLTGSGDIFASIKDTITGSISGSGDIHYIQRNELQVSVQTPGSGSAKGIQSCSSGRSCTTIKSAPSQPERTSIGFSADCSSSSSSSLVQTPLAFVLAAIFFHLHSKRLLS